MKLSNCAKPLKPKRGKKGKTSTVQLGGIWKDVKISSKGIKEARKTLLEKIEEKW